MMQSTSRLAALLLLGAAGSAGGLAAQVRGLPVRNAGIPTGLTFGADVGLPNADAGKGYAAGGTVAVGTGPLGFSVTFAQHDPKGTPPSRGSYGATANFKIFGGPLVPLSVTLQGGVGYEKDGANGDYHAPLGIGIALTIPNPAFSLKPWIAPRLDVTRLTYSPIVSPGATSKNESHFGISGGVDVGFLGGLSLRAMYDRVQVGKGVAPAVVSLGLAYRAGP